MDNDERQLAQVKMITESPLTPSYTKVYIYRNSVYAYPWFTSVRTILDDPAYAPWFIMFEGGDGPPGSWNTSSPACDDDYDPPLCTRYFHTQMDTPKPTTKWGVGGHPIGGYGKCYPKDNKTGCDCGTKPCGFYVFNHSSDAVVKGQTFQDWFLDSYMFNEVGADKRVSGFYWDDTCGLSACLHCLRLHCFCALPACYAYACIFSALLHCRVPWWRRRRP
eukprot:SAG25_NODE_1097_length_4023_cov_1.143221_5_plen_220_part_00